MLRERSTAVPKSKTRPWATMVGAPSGARVSLGEGAWSQAAKDLGAKGLLISSDLGQSANITHPDGIEVAVGAPPD